MKGYDLEIVEGSRKMPAIVFIHGLGMDKRIWVSPQEARVLAGQFPIHILLCKRQYGAIRNVPPTLRYGKDKLTLLGRLVVGFPDLKLKTVFHDLREKGFTLIVWSQSRPAATIDTVVSELREILRMSQALSPPGFILIGHSRGGLIGRRYLQHYRDERIKALITISTPHRGTRMATFVNYISPFASFIKPLIPESDRGRVIYMLKRISEFLSSRAVTELMPDSDLIRSLDGSEMNGVKYLSVGGSSPSLLCFNRILEVVEGKRKRVKMERIFSFPDAIGRFIPRRLLPPEIMDGKGDGLVSVESSRIPLATEHHTFRLNHAEILFSIRVREWLINKIKGLME